MNNIVKINKYNCYVINIVVPVPKINIENIRYDILESYISANPAKTQGNKHYCTKATQHIYNVKNK